MVVRGHRICPVPELDAWEFLRALLHHIVYVNSLYILWPQPLEQQERWVLVCLCHTCRFNSVCLYSWSMTQSVFPKGMVGWGVAKQPHPDSTVFTSPPRLCTQTCTHAMSAQVNLSGSSSLMQLLMDDVRSRHSSASALSPAWERGTDRSMEFSSLECRISLI